MIENGSESDSDQNDHGTRVCSGPARLLHDEFSVSVLGGFFCRTISKSWRRMFELDDESSREKKKGKKGCDAHKQDVTYAPSASESLPSSEEW